ncbi:MAG: bifunctional metallophosphatase/5'-nucleotidase [Oscillospiraceae bacterium]|nr:bifunctional metallophosphatase/5'-nucleotidase [Oscillospiraceae bacterium]
MTFIFCFFNSCFSVESQTKIVIYHTNDIHGQIESIWSSGILKNIGFDILKNIKGSTPNSILVDAGDISQGSIFDKLKNDNPIVEMMNLVGYDLMVPGNHDFDLGKDKFKKMNEKANFPIISANIKLMNSKDFLYSNFIKEVAGKKIAFFGITTSETKKTTIPENTDGLIFLDEIEVSKKQFENLKKQNVDAIIAITHLGNDPSTNHKSREIAQKLPGLTAIIDGHSHSNIVEKVNGVTIAQTGCSSKNLGKIELIFENNKLAKIESIIIPASEIGKTFISDNKIVRKYRQFYEKISDFAEKVIGKTDNIIFGGTYENQNVSRMFECPMGDLICDAMLFNGKNKLKLQEEFKDIPVIAFENGGAIRGTINFGYIKMSDIISVLPQNNKITAQIITPKILYEVFERGVGKMTISSDLNESFNGVFGGFPHISGAKINFDISNSAYNYINNSGGSRVKSVYITDSNEKEINILDRKDDKTKLILLCNDYTIHEFPSISQKEIIKKGDFLSDILAEYIQHLTFENGGSFSYPITKNRVNLINKFKNDNFDAEITVCDESGNLSNSEINVCIDNQKHEWRKTDQNGKITIQLKSGSHRITLKHGDLISEILLSNISDLKTGFAFLDNKSSFDFKSVSNIIKQIPYKILFDHENLIKFARKSYNSLNDKTKAQVFNYSKLVNAENEVSKFKENYFEYIFKNDHHVIFINLIIILISIAAFLIIKISKNKELSKSLNN